MLNYLLNPDGLNLLAQVGRISSQSQTTHWMIAFGVGVAFLVGLVAFSYTTRTGVIARATTKEAVRQPVFALLMGMAIMILILNIYLPFFSLGEDIKMLKDCGLATILISGLLLAVWTSSMSISQEIEGKTAMTLLSKPINRRQFIVGKYVGIVQAVLMLLVPLSLCLLAFIYYKVGYDAIESTKSAPDYREKMVEVLLICPGLVLIFLETAVLTAISVAISTRLPMIVNMVTCLAIFVVGHLTPVLVKTTTDNAMLENVQFMARLIATILPSLDNFNIQAAVATRTLVPPEYLGYSAMYCAAYTTAAILLAFILFEDRDLA